MKSILCNFNTRRQSNHSLQQNSRNHIKKLKTLESHKLGQKTQTTSHKSSTI